MDETNKIYWVKCNNFKKVVNLNIFDIFDKTVASIICSKCCDNNGRTFKGEEIIVIVKFLF